MTDYLLLHGRVSGMSVLPPSHHIDRLAHLTHVDYIQ
jgi:hypothetical protein